MTGTIRANLSIQPIAMTSYYPTLAVIAAAGFNSFRELYQRISKYGCQHDEYYTITYVNERGNIQILQVPVWKVLYNAILEISHIKQHRKK
jgi:hypothetical protein